MYKNLYVSEDSNVKKNNFDLRNKVSQRITRNGADTHLIPVVWGIIIQPTFALVPVVRGD